MDLGLGGTSLDDITASAGNGAVNVVRMDTLFHSFHLISGSDLLGPYYKCMCPSQPSISATPSSGLGNDCPIIIARIGQNARGIFKFFTAFSASSLFLRPAAPVPGKKAAAAQEKPRTIRINERFWAFTCRRRGSNPYSVSRKGF